MYALRIDDGEPLHASYRAAREALDGFALGEGLSVDAQAWTKRGPDVIGARGVLREDNCGEMLAVTDWAIEPVASLFDATQVTEADVEPVDVADRQWWGDVQAFMDGSVVFNVARFEAENDFFECGCMGRDWSCGHYGWSVAVIKVAA